MFLFKNVQHIVGRVPSAIYTVNTPCQLTPMSASTQSVMHNNHTVAATIH